MCIKIDHVQQLHGHLHDRCIGYLVTAIVLGGEAAADRVVHHACGVRVWVRVRVSLDEVVVVVVVVVVVIVVVV